MVEVDGLVLEQPTAVELHLAGRAEIDDLPEPDVVPEMRHVLRRELGEPIRTRIEKGERIGMWSPNRYEWGVAQFATARIGAVLYNRLRMLIVGVPA